MPTKPPHSRPGPSAQAKPRPRGLEEWTAADRRIAQAGALATESSFQAQCNARAHQRFRRVLEAVEAREEWRLAQEPELPLVGQMMPVALYIQRFGRHPRWRTAVRRLA